MLFEDEEIKNENEVVEEEDEEEVDEEKLEELESGIVPGLQDVNTVDLVKESFLDYAMSSLVLSQIVETV